MIRRCALVAPVFLLWLACAPPEPSPTGDRVDAGQSMPDAALGAVPHEEFYRSADVQTILDGARELMRADSTTALITVDSHGQPRVRSVRAFIDDPDPVHPERGLTIWIMTRLATRKVDQIRQHPQVSLYFNDDDSISYVSVMGIGTVHTDPETPGAKRHYDAEWVRMFWPEFPSDFVMIEVQALWLEYMGPGADNHPETWRPQAVSFGTQTR